MKRPSFKVVASGSIRWLECRPLSRIPWLLHAFSTRVGGVSKTPSEGLNLGFLESDRRQHVTANRKAFFSKIGAQSFELAELSQIHSARAYQAIRTFDGNLAFLSPGPLKPQTPAHRLPAGDAILTDQAGILLSVRVADCLPVLIVDRQRRAIGAVHAGWRGALEGVVRQAVREMQRAFRSRPGDFEAALGPSIRACCYEVGEEVRNSYCQRFKGAERFFRALEPAPAPTTAPQRTPGARPAARLDLVSVAVDQLRAAGVIPTRIHVADFCTACRTDLFFSHRKEGKATGRMMAVIGIRPSVR